MAYARVGAELWGSQAIGEHTQRQVESIHSKRKVMSAVSFRPDAFCNVGSWRRRASRLVPVKFRVPYTPWGEWSRPEPVNAQFFATILSPSRSIMENPGGLVI